MTAFRLPWLAFCAGVAFAVLALLLLIPLLDSQSDERIIISTTPHSFHAPKQNVFVDLTAEERASVTAFLHQRDDFPRHDDHSGSWTRIDQIEVLRPNKSDVLEYYDENGSQPGRYARVSVVRYKSATAKLVDYMVGPLPLSSTTAVQPLTWSYKSGRNWIKTLIADPMLLYLWIANVGHGMEDITQDLLGAKVNLLDPFSPESLVVGARPIAIEPEGMSLWLEFFRPGASSNAVSLLPQGLYVKLNMNSYDPDNWTTSELYYNGDSYANITAFRHAWESPGFVKLSRNLDGAWTDTEDFASKPHGRDQHPPLSVQPFGARYQLDRTQRYISWMGFSFYLGTLQSTGLSLFDVRFDGSRIIYHLGLQEAMAHYAGSEPIQSGLEFLDTFFGMGSQMFTLVPGYDCPAYADYLDMTYHNGNETFTNKKAICIFEYTSDAPLQRHTSEWSVTVSRNTYLVVRSVATVGNYDYTIDYLFYLDGSIEVKVRASGYIFAAFAGHPQTQPSSPNADTNTDELRSRSTPPFPHPNHRYGYQIHPSASTSMHDHTLLFRADLDISPSASNDTFNIVSINPYTHTYPWDASPTGPTTRNTMRLSHNLLHHESGLNYPPNANKMYLIQSPELNKWGENKAYRIHPGTGMGTPSHLTILNSTSLGRSAMWSQADLWVVKNKETETQGAHYLNYLSPEEPLVDFADIADGERLNVPADDDEDGDDNDKSDDNDDEGRRKRRGEGASEDPAGQGGTTGDDLVLYFNLGAHHVPSSSDIPNTLMHTSASSIMFSPFNYFDEDVSKYTRQGVRVDASTRENLGWREGMRVVGGGRYEDVGRGWKKGKREGQGERKRRNVVLDVQRDLEPDVGEYFEEGGIRAVGRRVAGGLWGLWQGRGL